MVEIVKMLLRRQDVEAISALSKSELYRRLREGTFPQPIVLADRVVRWVADEVREWVDARIAERDARPTNTALPPHPVREYWASRRAAKAAEESPASAEPPRKPRKPARPPTKLTKPKANGHRAPNIEARVKAPLKAAPAPLPKRRGRPPTLSPEQKAERTRDRRQADREYRRAGREALRQAAEAAERKKTKATSRTRRAARIGGGFEPCLDRKAPPVPTAGR
jgi:prophage regulatory protein